MKKNIFKKCIRASYYFVFFIVLCSLFACSTKNKVKKPEFEMLELTLAKGIQETGQKDVLLNPNTVFSTQDTAVIAYVRFVNMSDSNNLQWKWYGPDGEAYLITDNYPLKISKGKYVREASAWHKISIAGDKAQDLPGDWKVETFLNGEFLTAKYFKIKIDRHDIAYSIDADIPQTGMDNPNAIAVVIGNQNYQHPDIPAVKFAHNDATSVKNYLIKTLGYKDGNILFEKDITKARFEALFGIPDDHRGMLYDFIKQGESDVFIYYSGHGAPDISTQKGYFVPVDCDPSKMRFNGYALELFYQNISKLNCKKITIVLDACFSGGTNTGDWLISDASPALIRLKDPLPTFDNMIVLTSSQNDQISSWNVDQDHGLFTYFFLKALSGLGDKDNNKQLTYNEVFEFVSNISEGVPYWARRLYGRMQNPVMHGYGDDVLVEFLEQ